MEKQGWGYNSVVECLSKMCKALASNPSMQENKKKRKDRGVIGILPE
jgi:hypothetical protein